MPSEPLKGRARHDPPAPGASGAEPPPRRVFERPSSPPFVRRYARPAEHRILERGAGVEDSSPEPPDVDEWD